VAEKLSMEQPLIDAINELPVDRRPEQYLLCSASLSGTSVRDGDRRGRTHLADWYELMLVMKGAHGIATPTGIHLLTPGRLLLIEPGVEHGEFEVESEPERTGCDVCWFVARGTTMSVVEWKPAPQTGVSLDLLGSTDLTYVAEALSRELSGRDLHWQSSVQALLQHLACLLLRRLGRGSFVYVPDVNAALRSSDPQAWRLVETVLGYCASHYRQRVVVGRLASEAGYSRSHLSRVFAKHVGKTIAQHVQDLRMAEARHLLVNTGIPITQIAEMIGYNQYANFRRAFKTATGMSPRECRHNQTSP
jgi:AraC-like DNA-binding protein